MPTREAAERMALSGHRREPDAYIEYFAQKPDDGTDDDNDWLPLVQDLLQEEKNVCSRDCCVSQHRT